jgi:hypothetical protein
MPSAAFAGPGWSLRHNGTLIQEVVDISGPDQKAEFDDVTNQQSTEFYRERVPTLIDGGMLTANCNLIPGDGSQAGLLAAMQARTLEPFTLNPPAPYDATEYAFNAYVSDWAIKGPHAKKGELDIKLQISGPVAIT